MLKIDNLSAQIDDKAILRGLNLDVKAGEVHAIMGPNGAGKSTLGHVLAGRPGYEVTGGSAEFDGQSLFDLVPEERAQAGLFLAFWISMPCKWLRMASMRYAAPIAP